MTSPPPTDSIICGDCLKLMLDWPDNCVDLVFCSPPYEAARTYGIGFGLKGQQWVTWAFARYIECLRVCKGLVAWVIEGQTRQFRWSATPALLMADLHRAGIHLRKPPVFHRVGVPGSGGPDWLRNDYEFIICATSGGKLRWSDTTAMGHPPKWAPGGEMSNRLSDGARVNQWGGHRTSTERLPNGSTQRIRSKPSHRFQTKRDPDGNMREQSYDVPAIANPGNVIHCTVGGGTMGNKLCHENEAPFPESLCEFFVRSFCSEGGVVLDPFSGSGTACSVAAQHGRHYIGIDVRESQVELARKRIKQDILSSRGPLFVEKEQ